jgi:hypothetical protein
MDGGGIAGHISQRGLMFHNRRGSEAIANQPSEMRADARAAE